MKLINNWLEIQCCIFGLCMLQNTRRLEFAKLNQSWKFKIGAFTCKTRRWIWRCVCIRLSFSSICGNRCSTFIFQFRDWKLANNGHIFENVKRCDAKMKHKRTIEIKPKAEKNDEASEYNNSRKKKNEKSFCVDLFCPKSMDKFIERELRV